jgi:hypothetical protein
MGVPARLEDALNYTVEAIEASKDVSGLDSQVFAGMWIVQPLILHHPIVQPLPVRGVGEAGMPADVERFQKLQHVQFPSVKALQLQLWIADQFSDLPLIFVVCLITRDPF